ncbi:MAG: uroporphyrinogen decarboxylase family protein, partial [Anaerolineae bacterium]
IPDLIEAGVDILNPVQTSAAKMEPERLKREFGDRLVFWGGGCDVQGLLPRATPEEVEADVRYRLSVFAPGGGYVFAAIHDIQHDVPPANIVAMYDAARRWRL